MVEINSDPMKSLKNRNPKYHFSAYTTCICYFVFTTSYIISNDKNNNDNKWFVIILS